MTKGNTFFDSATEVDRFGTRSALIIPHGTAMGVPSHKPTQHRAACRESHVWLHLAAAAPSAVMKTEVLSIRVSTTDTAPEVAHGVLQRIDLIDREVTVRQENGLMTYSISPNCEVLLNGERVKLRMLQPRDHIRIAYRLRAERPAALSVEAQTRTGQPPAKNPIG